MKLNEIRDKEGAFSSRKRLGKGQGSGTGKTAGRGMKGQKSRSGSGMKGFEGGQMPLYRRVPKRGFNNPFRVMWQEVNVGRIEKYIELGKLDGGKDIDVRALCEAGLVRRVKDRVKLLGKGELKVKGLHVVVDAVSSGAKEALEKAGGRVTICDRKEILQEEKKAASEKKVATVEKKTATTEKKATVEKKAATTEKKATTTAKKKVATEKKATTKKKAATTKKAKEGDDKKG